MRIKTLTIGVINLLIIPIWVAGQNVGIGTPATTRAKLELHGMVGNTTAIFGANANGIGLVANAPSLVFNAYYNQGFRYISNGYAFIQYLNPGNGIFFFESAASGSKDAVFNTTKPGITISNDGRVGIGFNPGFNAQLNVGRDADKNGSAYFAAPQFSAINYTAAEYTAIRGGANLSKLYLNYYAQNSKIAIGVDGTMVGINSAGPVYPLEIRAPDFALALMRMGSQNQWIITVSQYYLKLFFRAYTTINTITQLGSFDYNTGQYSASSDGRMKKQVEPLPPMLEKIMQLQPRNYQMKFNNPNHDKTFGLVAQEVNAVFPSLVRVTQNANTGYDNISDLHLLNYSGLAPFLIKALQEQQAQLDSLEQRTTRLEAKR